MFYDDDDDDDDDDHSYVKLPEGSRGCWVISPEPCALSPGEPLARFLVFLTSQRKIHDINVQWILLYYIPGSSKKTAILSNSLRRNLHAPFPQFNVATSLCLERPSKKTAISVWMPASIGQQHWSRGHGGIRCDVTACRRMAVFFEEPGIILIILHIIIVCIHIILHIYIYISCGIYSHSWGISLHKKPGTSRMDPQRIRSIVASFPWFISPVIIHIPFISPIFSAWIPMNFHSSWLNPLLLNYIYFFARSMLFTVV